MCKTTTTFKEPFLKRVQDALDGAGSITWEGCHKIYICMDAESHEQLIEFGYDMILVGDKDEALEQLFDWWNEACPLRFISACKGKDKFDRVIPQFDYDE